MGNGVEVVRRAGGFVVVDKPAGLLSVPGRGAALRDCVVERVRANIPDARGPMVVHRLDMETSGLMVVALSAEAQRALSMQFEARTVGKRYEALLDGRVDGESGVAQVRQRLDVDRRPLQVVDPLLGREAVTAWRVIGRGRDARGEWTRAEFRPRTGRSHQLRLAAATAREMGGLGAPIRGDTLYGAGAASGARLLLHATGLEFDDPGTGERVVCESRAPF